jgi:hypothetical protein
MPSIHKYTLVRSVPKTVSRDKLLTLLHEPTTIFHLSPIIVRWKEIEEDPGASSARPSRIYEVTDAVSFLPFGLYDTTVKVKIEFANFEHGVVITKHAIFGLVFRETWTIRTCIGPDGSAGQVDKTQGDCLELSLSVEMSGNSLTVPAFKSMMEKNHLMYLEKVVERGIEVSVQDSRSPLSGEGGKGA